MSFTRLHLLADYHVSPSVPTIQIHARALCNCAQFGLYNYTRAVPTVIPLVHDVPTMSSASPGNSKPTPYCYRTPHSITMAVISLRQPVRQKLLE